MSFLDSWSSEMDQNAFIASIFKKNLKAFSFLISSVARGSAAACYWSQAMLDQCVHCDAIRCRIWLLSRARLSLWYADQSREASRVITFFYHWRGANKAFKHFASDKYAMMMHCLSLLWAMIWAYCPSWSHHAIASSVWGLNCYNILERYSFLGRHCLLLHVQHWTVRILRTFVRWLSCLFL
jgi:hypothetical protein